MTSIEETKFEQPNTLQQQDEENNTQQQPAVPELDASGLYTNPQELEQVLYSLTQPNNEALRHASRLMRLFLQKKEAVMPLVEQIEKSQHPEARQVAAVYLREVIEEYYKDLPQEIKPRLKQFLIEKLIDCQNRAERLAIAGAIASVGKFAFIHNEGWNDLLLALDKICKPEQNLELKEVGFILWRNLISYCGGALKSHFGAILKILQEGLKDTEAIAVQVEAVKAIGEMVEFLESQEEVDIIAGIIPDMVAVIDKCLKQADETNVIAGMEVFNNLVECKVPVLHTHSPELTKFNLKIAAAKDELPMTVRKQATNFCTWMCKSKPKTVIKNNFVKPFLTLCINLIIESQDMENEEEEDNKASANLNANANASTNGNTDGDGNGNGNANANENDNDEDDDKDEDVDFLSPLNIACDLLDEIYLNVPSEQCFPVSIKAMEQLLKDALPKRRKSGYVLLAMMAEGCKEIIARDQNLVNLLTACVKGCGDESAVVRKCALEAISQIAAHLSLEILTHHKLILDCCFNVFANPNEAIRVKERALSAIEMFIDAYDPDADDRNPQNNGNGSENTNGNGNESGDANASGGGSAGITTTDGGGGGGGGSDEDGEEVPFSIVTYLPSIMNAIAKCLETESIHLQEQAISTLTSCATAAKGNFAMYAPKIMQILESLLTATADEKLELRANATQCLGAVAVAIGGEAFAPLFQKFHAYVMAGLLEIDHSRVRESSFMYFSDVAELMKTDLLQLDCFEEMLQYVLFTIEDDDGLMVELPDDGFGDAIPTAMLEEQIAQEHAEEHALLGGGGGVVDPLALEETKLDDLSPAQIEELCRDVVANARANQTELDNGSNNHNGEGESDEDGEVILDADGNPVTVINRLTDEELNEILLAEAAMEQEMYANAVGQLKSVKLSVTTGFMEEKAAALHALTYFIKNCGFGFLEYMDECWERLTYLWEYPHALVKMAVSNCFHEFFTLLVNFALHEHANAQYTKEKNAKYPWRQWRRDPALKIEYSTNIQNWLTKIFPLYIQAFRDEDDREALGVVLEYFVEELRVLGPDAISDLMDELIAAIILFLKEKSACQLSSDPQNLDVADIATKHKWISDTVAELIAVLAELWADQFADLFAKIFASLLEFGRASRHPHDQAMAVGCIADCCSRLAENDEQCQTMSPFSDTVFQLALRIAQSQEVNMRQNALYCMGAMFTACNQSSNLQHSTSVLRCVKVYMQFDRDGDHSTQLVRDNAVSALGKILISEPQALPITDLLPSFIDALPLTADFTENSYIYDILRRFVLNEFEIIQPHIQQTLELCGLAVADTHVPQETTDNLVEMFQQICRNPQIQEVVAQLSQSAQENIMQCVQHGNSDE